MLKQAACRKQNYEMEWGFKRITSIYWNKLF
jgi:hypothetical protein